MLGYPSKEVTSINNFSSLKEKNNKVKFLYDYPLGKDNILKLEDIKEIDKISIISDTMFHAMFNNPKRLMYSAYLISLFLDIEYEILLKNMRLTSTDVPKDKEASINQRCDYVCEIGDTVITIEMNNNSSIDIMHRNIDYNNKRFNSKVKNSDLYGSYSQSILFNLNNFSFVGKDKVYYINYIKDEEGTALTDKIIIINIYLPNLLEKCYTLGIESLDEIEKFIYALIEVDEDKLKDLMKEIKIVKEYVNEAKEVSMSDEILESYDHEKANMDQHYIYGKEEGLQEGIKQGKKEEKIDLIKSMYKNDASLEFISQVSNLSVEEVKRILEIS